jgi:hypothetical protein
VKVEKAESGSKARDEFIFDAMPFSEFVIIFEKGFDSDLLLPDFSSDTCFDILDGSDSIDWGNLNNKLCTRLSGCLLKDGSHKLYFCYQ